MIPNSNTLWFRLLPKLNQFESEQELPQHTPKPKPTFQGPYNVSHQIQITISHILQNIHMEKVSHN